MEESHKYTHNERHVDALTQNKESNVTESVRCRETVRQPTMNVISSSLLCYLAKVCGAYGGKKERLQAWSEPGEHPHVDPLNETSPVVLFLYRAD